MSSFEAYLMQAMGGVTEVICSFAQVSHRLMIGT